MNFGIVGYGKMGKSIEQQILKRGHKVSIIIDQNNTHQLNATAFKNVDVAIEFTNPHVAFKNVKTLIDLNVPVVCGSTGWGNQMQEIHNYCLTQKGSLLVSSNFSIGVNVFFKINEYVSTVMSKLPDYHLHIEETHHNQKKDTPSGTAITLAEIVMKAHKHKTKWVENHSTHDHELPIISTRQEDVVGLHILKYRNDIDEIEIKHNAFSREGFALGAVMAAEFIYNKKGIFSMADVIGNLI